MKSKRKKNTKKYLTKKQVSLLLKKEMDKFKSAMGPHYEQALKPGEIYLRTFNTSFDPKEIGGVPQDPLNYIYEHGANLFALIVGAFGIYIGYKITIHGVGTIIERLGQLLKKLVNTKYLGLFLMAIGIFTIGLKLYYGRDKSTGMAYMMKIQKVDGLLNSTAQSIINVTRKGELSLSGLFKRIVFSILSFFDLSVVSVKRLATQASEDYTTQIGIVLFGLGLLLFWVGKASES